MLVPEQIGGAVLGGGWSQYLELGSLLLLTQVFLWLLKTSEEREVVFLLLLIQIY